MDRRADKWTQTTLSAMQLGAAWVKRLRRDGVAYHGEDVSTYSQKTWRWADDRWPDDGLYLALFDVSGESAAAVVYIADGLVYGAAVAQVEGLDCTALPCGPIVRVLPAVLRVDHSRLRSLG